MNPFIQEVRNHLPIAYFANSNAFIRTLGGTGCEIYFPFHVSNGEEGKKIQSELQTLVNKRSNP